jgi:hypothetical protein
MAEDAEPTSALALAAAAPLEPAFVADFFLVSRFYYRGSMEELYHLQMEVRLRSKPRKAMSEHTYISK